MGSRVLSTAAALVAAVLLGLPLPAQAGTIFSDGGAKSGTQVTGLIAAGSLLATASAGLVYLILRLRRVDDYEDFS